MPLKKIGLVILILLILFSLLNLNLISYGVAQLKGQLTIINNSVDIEKAILENEYTDEQKRKLLLIKEVKQFAIDSLGLKNSKSYQTIYNQNNKDILWTITACEPFKLLAYQWKFPFLGSVPYKGFFEYGKGQKELNKLTDEGYDTEYSAVSGWSTLGWFGDPILSNMLKRSEGSLAELIIHELTHATIFIKNDIDYNENLATFIGKKGAEKFLLNKFGKSSKQHSTYLSFESDKMRYTKHMLNGANKLDSLYNNLNHELSVESKNIIKNDLIFQIVSNIDTIKFNNPEKFKWDIYKKQIPNNTLFMSYLRYRKKQHKFENVYQEQFNGDLAAFIKHAHSKFDSN